MKKFQMATLSKCGGRQGNEDSSGNLMFEDCACWVVADGLGGHKGGEVAANLAVETILTSFRYNREITGEALERHFTVAQEAIAREQQRQAKLRDMRTTVAVLTSDYKTFLCAHAGDSRIYHFRDGRIVFQTKDHSVAQSLADGGAISRQAIRHHPDRNRLLRSLGTDEMAHPAIRKTRQPIKSGDAFLLCVDGFWEYLLETEMEAELAKAHRPADWLAGMETRILRRAKEAHDNYTGVAIFC